MTLKPRKAHVKRVFRVDDSGNVDDSIWIDVLRIEEFSIDGRGFPSGIDDATTRFKFKWNDDPALGLGDVQNENGNTVRKTKKLKIENPEDDTTSLDLRLVTRQRIDLPNTHGDRYGDWSSWFFKFVYDNNPTDGSDGTPSDRPKVNKVRIVNNDLGGLKMDLGSTPVDWEKVYLPALKDGTTDKTQYVDVEFVKFFHLTYGQQPDGDASHQTIKYRIQNDAIVKLLDAGGAGTKGDGRPTTVYRIDPLQMVVNVGWAVIPEFVCIRFNVWAPDEVYPYEPYDDPCFFRSSSEGVTQPEQAVNYYTYYLLTFYPQIFFPTPGYREQPSFPFATGSEATPSGGGVQYVYGSVGWDIAGAWLQKFNAQTGLDEWMWSGGAASLDVAGLPDWTYDVGTLTNPTIPPIKTHLMATFDRNVVDHLPAGDGRVILTAAGSPDIVPVPGVPTPDVLPDENNTPATWSGPDISVDVQGWTLSNPRCMYWGRTGPSGDVGTQESIYAMLISMGFPPGDARPDGFDGTRFDYSATTFGTACRNSFDTNLESVAFDTYGVTSGSFTLKSKGRTYVYRPVGGMVAPPISPSLYSDTFYVLLQRQHP